MSEQPNTARGDVAYWGLTHAQAARYHARISRMYADRAARFRDLSVAYWRKAEIASLVSFIFAGIALIVFIVGAVIA